MSMFLLVLSVWHLYVYIYINEHICIYICVYVYVYVTSRLSSTCHTKHVSLGEFYDSIERIIYSYLTTKAPLLVDTSGPLIQSEDI